MVVYMRKKRIDLSKIIIMAFLAVWGLAIFYPFYNSIITSFMTEKEYFRSSFSLFPKKINLDAYRFVFSYSKIYTGYISTLIIVLIGVPYNMFLSITTAYGLSRRDFPGKKIINSMVIFTMYFSGGVIPMYLLIKSMGLINNYLSVILVYGVNTFYMIIMKNYFTSIPESIEESARIDGANDLIIMLKIYIPLSMPIMATFFLFFTVDRWNEWFNAMLYLMDGKKWPLQLVLREIISTTNSDLAETVTSLKINFSIGIKMATIVVTMVPIMLVYPFVQKYFIKGILVGAVKS